MSLKQRGLDFIHAFDLPKIELWPGTLLTVGDIAETFRLSISCEYARVPKGETLDPLASRASGLPHMPEGVDWPKSTYLVAQLNLAEVAKFGLWEAFPTEGTAYLFFDPFARGEGPFSPSAAHLILADNDSPRTLREAPADAELPGGGEYYREEFVSQTYAITMKPIFSLGYEDVPSALISGLEAELGMACGEDQDGTIGGSPVTYQDEEPGDLFAPRDWDFMQTHPLGDRFLFFQGGFADGMAHYWVQQQDLASGQLRQVDMTYSGT